MSDQRPRAFTLIELLVVVAIIVVLIAIMMPALDKAIYQAELAVCGANLKAIASGAVSYSQSNKQMFPYRTAIEANPLIGGSATTDRQGDPTGTVKVQPYETLKTTPAFRYRRINTLAEGIYDDRALIRPYISMKALVDPLCGAGTINLDDPDPDNTVYIYSDYALFFGMKFEKWNGHMRKFGTPMRMTDHFYTTMAVDLNVYFDQQGTTFSSVASHPDKAGVSTLQERKNEGGYLDSSWVVPATSPSKRGVIDTNQATWDGAVHRFKDIRWDETDTADNDYFSDATWQADGNWYAGAIEFWGEIGSRGKFNDPSRPVITVNP